MPDDVLDVNAVSSPAPDVTAPSAEPTPSSEQGTPSPTPVVEESKIPLSRLNEVLEQKKQAEAREAQLLSMLQQARQPMAPLVPAEDPWAGLTNHSDPATAQFYQQQQRLFQHEAQKVASQQGQSVMQAVDAGRRELAALKIASFRRENPEIKPGSPEESAIAGYVSQGLDLDMSKKLALYDKLDAENRALKGKQSAIPSKVAANVEQSQGIPATAGLPGKPGGWRQDVADAYDASGGDLLAVTNALTRTKR